MQESGARSTPKPRATLFSALSYYPQLPNSGGWLQCIRSRANRRIDTKCASFFQVAAEMFVFCSSQRGPLISCLKMRFNKRTEDLIADFRGLPRTVTSSSRRDPTALDNLLVVLKEQYKLEEPSPERSLVENWTEVFGPSLAGRCHPVRIKDKETLIISVTNQTLRSELQFHKRQILKRIQALAHCSKINELVIRS